MTFTAHETAGPPEASYDVLNSRAEYTVRYRLTAGSASDGAAMAIAYTRSNIADDGTHYAFGNDSDTSAKLRTITPSREAGSNNHWIVTLQFADPDRSSGGENQDGGGETTGDPLQMAPEVEVQTVNYTIPAARGIHRGGFTGEALNRIPVGDEHAICNSAFVTYDPPIEKDDHRLVIRVLKNMPAINCNEIRANVVNDSMFNIDYRGIGFAVGARNGKVRDVTVRQASATVGDFTLYYVKVQLYIDVVASWWLDVLDRGYHARAEIGDPNGKGGTIYESPPAGQPKVRRLQDPMGLPVNEPQLLDGNGQPLADPGTDDPVYIKWEVYPEVDFKTWGIFEGILR